MIRSLVIAVTFLGFAIYVTGYAISGVLAYRLKKWGWLFALLVIGPISYPFYAVINRSTSPTAFRCFWVGLAIIVLGVVALRLIGPAVEPSAY